MLNLFRLPAIFAILMLWGWQTTLRYVRIAQSRNYCFDWPCIYCCLIVFLLLKTSASIRSHSSNKELKTELWSNVPRCSVRLLLKQNSRSPVRKHRSPERLFRTIEPKVRKPSRNFRTLKRKSRTSEPKARKPSRNFRSLERKTRTLEHFVWTCKFKVNIVK